LTLILIVLCAVASGAEERFGVKVFTGAKPDKDTSAWLSEAFSAEAFCYRTSDNLNKVMEFYKKESGLEFMGKGKEGDKEGAMFKKGDVDITIQNPWMDMKTGQIITKETLITILKYKESGQNQP